MRESRFLAEPVGRPILAPDGAVRAFRDRPQRQDASRVLRPVDGLGQPVIRRQLVGRVGKAVEVNLKAAVLKEEHEAYEDLAVSWRPSPLRALPTRLALAEGRRLVMEPGAHGQPMPEGSDDYGMVFHQVKSSGDEVKLAFR